jgi:hypothetical protein
MEDALDHARISMERIKFSDLELDSSQLSVLKSFED